MRASKQFTEAYVSRSVKDELRANLIRRLQDQSSAKNADPIFPGIVGFDDTVVPQIINAILSRQNFILLGLRGQARAASCARSPNCSILLPRTSPVRRFATIRTAPFRNTRAI